MTDFAARALALDAADPLGGFRARFLPADGVGAYLDGNSLGRPLADTPQRIAEFVAGEWGQRLIRSWDEGWLSLPERQGDRIGRVVGAAAGQTVVGDSTTVMLHRFVRAALDARPGRRRVVAAAADFPTDRFVLRSVADLRGLELVLLEAPHDGAVDADAVAEAAEGAALVLLSHVAFRSAAVADAPAITDAAHEAGALVLWDLSHAAGAVPVELDGWGADLAVGCTYKYLGGGPGAPAFGYVARRLQGELRNPLPGWLSSARPFEMGERYEQADGIRGMTAGTPPVLGMVAMEGMLDAIEQAGMPAIRAKSIALTDFTVEFWRERLVPHGVRLASPADADRRGSHVTLDHPAFQAVVAALWRRGVIPDFRRPDGLRIGLSPLSTGFTELAAGLAAVEEELAASDPTRA